MPLQVTPKRSGFFAEIEGVDLARGIDAATVTEIEQALDRHGVVLFRKQTLDQAQHVAFGRLFGPLEITLLAYRPNRDPNMPAEISDVSNLERDGSTTPVGARRRMSALGNRMWHTDSSFMTIPAKYSLLYGRQVPSDGKTEFADMRGAYDALAPEMKERIKDFVVEHSIVYSRGVLGFSYSEQDAASRPPSEQRLVRYHPGSGRTALYHAAHAMSIKGMAVPEARVLLMELMEHAVQRRFVHSHHWRQGDLVIWDNRTTMHRSMPSDPTVVRDLHRVTVMDYASSLEQPTGPVEAKVRGAGEAARRSVG